MRSTYVTVTVVINLHQFSVKVIKQNLHAPPTTLSLHVTMLVLLSATQNLVCCYLLTLAASYGLLCGQTLIGCTCAMPLYSWMGTSASIASL